MKYDKFQEKSIGYIKDNYSVIVSAPTGTGKTKIAEYVIQRALERDQKVIYTAPIKSLSNQKFRDFSQENGSNVGILTGDVTINAEAPVLIMTTEIFRNKILEGHDSLKEYSWVVFDEIHYIDDYARGSVWEESIIFMPQHMRLLGLSATIPNVDQLAQWITKIHGREVKVVKETVRIVPLHISFQCQNTIYNDYECLRRQVYETPKLRHYKSYKVPRTIKLKANELSPLIAYLLTQDLFPCIYFVFSRKKAEGLAEDIQGYQFLTDQEHNDIQKKYAELCRRYSLEDEPSSEKLKHFIHRGIAYHHAGMLPTLKEVVEQLFTLRLIKVIFTTETFALGINMPARAVIFDELRKFYGVGGGGFMTLRTRDFFQMAGRSGRRGIDKEGFVFCRVDPHDIGLGQLKKIIFSEPERVYSQFNTSYATILNLYQSYGDRLYDIYPKSLHYYQAKAHLRKAALRYMRAKVDILKEMGHIKDKKVTPKGNFAAQVYGYELLLTEMYVLGELENFSEVQLAIFTTAAVYESRKGRRKPRISNCARAIEYSVRNMNKRIHKLEKFVGLSELSKKFYFHLSPAIEGWICGEDFGSVLAKVDSDEGELVRAFRMVIQMLNEIAGGSESRELKNKCYKLIRKIDRGVVDSEKQLRG